MTCNSDEESDKPDDEYEDPNYLLPVIDISNEASEITPMVLEVNEEDPPEVKVKEKQRKSTLSRLYWNKVSRRETTPPIPKFLMQNKNDEERLPMEYFKNFISNKLLDKICEQLNIYALQKNVNKPLLLHREKLEQWIGIAMQISVTKISDTRMHWS